MPSSFLQTLLSTPYPSVFGNALTMEEANTNRRANGLTGAETLRQQYDAAQQAAINAATNLGAAQSAAASEAARQQYYRDKMNDLHGRGVHWGSSSKSKGTDADNTAVTDAANALALAQKNASRAFDQYQLAQQTERSRPQSMQQAVNWGQLAQQAENRMINQAAGAAANAIANENARMATLAAHPLLGGGIR